MGNQPQPKSGIMDIELYVGGKAPANKGANSVKLSSNENPFGASKMAREAYASIADDISVYPASDHGALQEALAKQFGLNADQMILGNGSDELISFICNGFAGEGDEVMFTEHGFAMYRICAQAAGATPVEVAETNRHLDVDLMLGAITERTKIIFLANPNNPTGTFVSLDDLARLAAEIPPHVLLVIDAAYAEYVEGYDGGASLVEAHDNVVMTRTFSKLFGLGGLRIGWAYAPKPILEVLARLRGPFNVNAGALAAAMAALNDTEFTEFCLAENRKWGAYLTKGFRELGLECDDSYANFVLVRFPSQDAAEAAKAALSDEGIEVRGVANYNLPEGLRITIGKAVDCKRVLRVIENRTKAG